MSGHKATMRLEGKTALVTGAGSGIGRAAAILFAREGARVIVVDIVPEGGKETCEMISSAGGKATFCQGDVSVAGDAKRMAKTAVEAYGRLNVVFNNAGYNQYGTVEEIAESDWDRQMAVNLKGVVLVSKYSIEYMKREQTGSIVNTASSFGIVGRKNDAAYCASKGAVIALTREMAVDCAPAIRVNCICPGPTFTPRIEKAIKSAPNPEERAQEALRSVLLKRFAKAEEIANCALFLASDESSYVTGATLVVDGGQTIT